jgi:hypothetical protein
MVSTQLLSDRYDFILQYTEYLITFLVTNSYPARKSPKRRQYGLFFTKSEARYGDTLARFARQVDTGVYMPAKGIGVYFRKCFLAERMM